MTPDEENKFLLDNAILTVLRLAEDGLRRQVFWGTRRGLSEDEKDHVRRVSQYIEHASALSGKFLLDNDARMAYDKELLEQIKERNRED